MNEEIISRIKKARKELDTKLRSCKCLPWIRNNTYCEECKKVIIEFLDTNGAGVLCGDMEIEYLEKENGRLKNENCSLKLNNKNILFKYNKLKEKLKDEN